MDTDIRFLIDNENIYFNGSSEGESLETLGNENGNSSDVGLLSLRIFICVLGVVGNLLVIFVVLVLREYKKTVTHW